MNFVIGSEENGEWREEWLVAGGWWRAVAEALAQETGGWWWVLSFEF